MLAVRGRLEQRQAIVEIGVQRFDLEHVPVGPEHIAQPMAIASYRALLDTGAQRTCLTHRTIGIEKLQRHGKRAIKNVHNQNLHSLFMAKLGFWCQGDFDFERQEYNRSYYGLEFPVEVIDIADNERFDAIVGMDVLERFDFSFSKSGDFSISLD